MDVDLVIITADEPFSDNWHTQVIYAEHLSKDHEVLYVEPPAAWHPGKLFRLRGTRQIRPGLSVMPYANIFPSALNVLNERINTRSVCRFAQARKAKRLLIWHFDSFRSLLDSSRLRSEFTIKRLYHVIDPFMNNPLDRKLTAIADLVLVANPENAARYRELGARIQFVPQGIDAGLARSLLIARPDTKVRFTSYLVLLGTISDDADLETLRNLADEGINILVIGKCAGLQKNRAAFDALLALPGIQYLGLLHPRRFYPLLKSAAGGLVLYNAEKRERGRFAVLKFLHYLVAGIPVISNTDCGVPALTGECIHLSENRGELARLAYAALAGSLKLNSDLADSYLAEVDLHKLVSNISAGLHAV